MIDIATQKYTQKDEFIKPIRERKRAIKMQKPRKEDKYSKTLKQHKQKK